MKDYRACDGSRQFAEFSESASWHTVRDHVSGLSGARLTGFLTDYVTAVWIDFTYQRNSFTINNQFGEYWLFVDDPACPDMVLADVVMHFSEILLPVQNNRG